MNKTLKIISALFSVLLVLSLTACTQAENKITEISVTEINQQFLDSHLIIDVREPSEFATGYIENAVLMPMRSLQAQLPAYLQKHLANQSTDQLSATPILLYCRSGNRSGVAADFLQKMGYTNVVSLKGGIRDWKAHKKAIKLK